MREIKFRVWDEDKKGFVGPYNIKTITQLLYDEDDNVIFQQFSGLKDKQGEEIFEGDIVKTVDGNYQIVFVNGAFRFGVELIAQVLSQTTIDAFNVEVIGNIHENGELI